MSIDAVQELITCVKTLPAPLRNSICAQYDLSKIDVFTAEKLLNKIKASKGVEDPIRNSVEERVEQLQQKKKKSTALWERLRAVYYKLVAKFNKEGSIESKKEMENGYLDMALAGERMVNDTKYANNAEIQVICNA